MSHGRQTASKGIHAAISWTFANAANRVAFTPTTGIPATSAQLTADDLTKFALQEDNNSVWILTDISPVTWTGFGGAPTGAASGQLSGTYPSPSVAGVTETSGPTALTLGAVADGQYLRRSGATLIGDTPTGGSDVTIRLIANGVATGIAAFGAVTLGPFTRVVGEIPQAIVYPNNTTTADEWTMGDNFGARVSWRFRNDGVATPNVEFNLVINNGTGGVINAEWAILGVSW